jgi:hypothetical protein
MELHCRIPKVLRIPKDYYEILWIPMDSYGFLEFPPES